VETSHAFFTWFAEVENEMDGEQEAGYRRHLAVMQSYLAVCDAMLDDVDKSRAFLDTLTYVPRGGEGGGRAKGQGGDVHGPSGRAIHVTHCFLVVPQGAA
jgi:hypothetical protein